ncbi:MAG: DUF5057 domain-containing protein [Clostridia bacterium]|nr:DUF5057 domain-containing protein [Clostridia bacterium]
MKNSKLVKVTSAALALAIAGGTFLSYFRIPAGATESLNNIENIKKAKQNAKEDFNIVEIAPDAQYGTMGYYVDGQEPQMVSGMINTISRMDDMSERSAYAQDIMTRLAARGLISDTPDAAPLLNLGNYREHYPWDSDFYTGHYNENATELQLLLPEKFTRNSSNNVIRGTAVPRGEGESGNGFDYTMSYNYAFVENENIYDFSQWYSKRVASWNNEDEAKQLTNSGSFNYDETKRSLTFEVNGATSDLKFPAPMVNGYPLTASLVPGKTYTVYYSSAFERVEDGTDDNGDVKYKELETRVLPWFSSDGTSFTQPAEAPNEEDPNVRYVLTSDEAGSHSFSFTAQGSEKYLALSFGAKGTGKAEIFNVSVYEDKNANYVQNITQYLTGEPGLKYGDNLFNAYSWFSNSHSQRLVNRTAGDSIEFKREDNIISIKSDSEGSDVYTGYSAPDAYFINADPGATYEMEFQAERKSGSGSEQLTIIPYKAGLQQKSNVTFGGSTSDSFNIKYSQTQEGMFRFTVDSNTYYLKFAFGVEGKSTSVDYSSIRIRKILSDPVYYYDIEPVDEYYYNNSADVKLPPTGTSVYTLGSDGKYNFEGVYYSDDNSEFSLNIHKRYFSVKMKDGTRPSLTKDANHPYYGVPDDNNPYIAASPGFFARDNGELNYVGMGADTATYKIDFTGNDLLTVNSQFIYYTGGYKNNKWFKYNTLDANEKLNGEDLYTFGINVSVFDPLDPMLVKAINGADLIVISSGLSLHSSAAPAFASDLPADSSIPELLKTKIDDKDAVMIDKSLAFNDSIPNLRDCVRELIKTETENPETGETEVTYDGKVSGSLYSFSASDISQNGAAATTIANSNYCTEPGKIIEDPPVPDSSGEDVFGSYVSQYSSSPYFPVAEEIFNENDMRVRVKGNEAVLEHSSVNEATCIRYILNYKHHRIYKTLENITVLDIEPASSNPSLTVAKLNLLMPDDNQFEADNVEIVGMSVSEFVAKNEDFAENYDLIYIGASTDNMSRVLQKNDSFDYITKDGETGHATTDENGLTDPNYQILVEQKKVPNISAGDPLYNDLRMNGMYYTNVGDTIESANKEALDTSDYDHLKNYLTKPNQMLSDLNNPPALGGMLKEDYWQILNTTFYIPKGGHATVRTAGNDLNASAMERLENYVNSGRPLIVDDKLITPAMHSYLTAYCHADDLEPDYVNGGYKCTFHCSIIDNLPASYDPENINPEQLSADIRSGAVRTINHNPDVTLTYQWYYDSNPDDNVPGTLIPGATLENYTAQITTTSMEPDGTRQITRTRRVRIGSLTLWSRQETVTVQKYKATDAGLGNYYCKVDFSYHGFSASGKETNKVRIKMGGTDYFAARLFSNAYFPKQWDFGDDGRADYWVEFHDIDENYLTSSGEQEWNSGENITNYILNKYKVKFEYWDEQHDWRFDCDAHPDGHQNIGYLRRVLYNNSMYENFNAFNYSDGPFTHVYCDLHDWWRINKCYNHQCTYSPTTHKEKKYCDRSNNKDDWKDAEFSSNWSTTVPFVNKDTGEVVYTKTATNYNNSTGKYVRAGEILSIAANRVICRMTFNVGGKDVVFKSQKAGGPLTQVLVSRSTGDSSNAEKHDDFDTYPFSELYTSYWYQGGSLKQEKKAETNLPEYIYQIAEVDKVPVKSAPTRWRVDTASEASSDNIDNCSYMWRFIVGQYYEHRTSMFAYDDALNGFDDSRTSSLLARALKTPKPEIEIVAGTSPEYSVGDISESMEPGPNGSILKVRFRVNETSGSFKDSTYKADLYVDNDGDGKFSPGEKVRSAGVTGIRVKSDENSDVYEYTYDEVSRTGVIPWKIVLIEENPSGRVPTHMSHTGFAFVKPPANNPDIINAIMVMPGAWNPAEWVEHGKSYLNIQNEVIGKTFKVQGKPKIIKDNYWSENEYIGPIFASPIFDQLASETPSTRRMRQDEFPSTISFTSWDGVGGTDDGGGHSAIKQPLYHLGFVVNGGDIKIMITCVSLYMLNDFYGINSGDGFGGQSWTCTNPACKKQNKSGMNCKYCGYFKSKTNKGSDFLDDYDMMILGFGDSYGKLASGFLDIAGNQVLYREGMSNYTALAIDNYINFNKQDHTILFCHDTTNKSVDFLDLTIDEFKKLGANIWNTGAQIVNWVVEKLINPVIDFVQRFVNTFTGGTVTDENSWMIAWRADTQNKSLYPTKVQQGFWNNLILRDSVGLDRYGATYAIKKRSEAIAYKKYNAGLSLDNDAEPYNKNALGRAHMFNYLYNGYRSQGDFGDFNVAEDDKFIIPEGTEGRNKYDLSISHFIENDYSIAWVPGTADVYGRGSDGKVGHLNEKGEMVYEGQPILNEDGNITADFDRYTQGFTDYTIARYINPNNTTQLFPSATTFRQIYRENFDNLKADAYYQKPFKTDKVTQVNGGKITKYPYDVNIQQDRDGRIDGYLHNNDDMNQTQDIMTTHEQVYQCNMNGDDITVWYALAYGDFWTATKDADGKYTYTGKRNDAENAYFLFSRGNVIYTGAGHTNTFTLFEAKLFINTLVVSAKSGYADPDIRFRDSIDSRDVQYLTMIPTASAAGEDSDDFEPEDYIYFKIEDSDVASEGVEITDKIEFYLQETSSTGTITEVPVTDIEWAVANTDSFSSDTSDVYVQTLLKMSVPESIKQQFNDNETLTSVKLYARVVKTVKEGGVETEDSPYTNPIPPYIEIRRIDFTKLE